MNQKYKQWLENLEHVGEELLTNRAEESEQNKGKLSFRWVGEFIRVFM